MTTTEPTRTLDWMVSVDDHIVEPPNLWVDRVAAKDRDRAPRVIREDGVDYWAYEDVRAAVPGETVAASQTDRTKVNMGAVNYEDMDPAIYDPVERVKAMNRAGVAAQTGFPFFPRYCGQTFLEAADRDFGWTCLRAYNDWVLEDWAGSAPGRFIPLVILPLWDPKLAVGEIERCAAKGAKAITFSENPSKLGLPSIHDQDQYWDPVFSAAEDTDMPLCIHFGSSSTIPTTSPDAPMIVWATLAPVNLMFCLTDWLFSNVLLRHDKLKICLSEGGIGWIPYMLERSDWEAKDKKHWVEKGDYRYDVAGKSSIAIFDPSGARNLDVLPSELFAKHVYGCFINDEFGARNLEAIGVDNVMMESDYPHGDGTYPDSIQAAHRLLEPYDDEVKYKVFMGNACRVFNFEPTIPDAGKK